jgi:biotin carboxyl carrier protein
VVLLNTDRETKLYTLLINGTKYEVSLKDKFDDLLAGMGMAGAATGKANNLKAPMPGLVLNILVTEGDSFKPGDALVVLEAMKMENIIKAAGEGTVKKISVNKGQAVEKGQVLIEVN